MSKNNTTVVIDEGNGNTSTVEFDYDGYVAKMKETYETEDMKRLIKAFSSGSIISNITGHGKGGDL